MNFDLSYNDRQEILSDVWAQLESFYNHTSEVRVTPVLNREEVLGWIGEIEETRELDVKKATSMVIEGLKKFAVHTPHPDYFGLFNPRPTFAGVIADLITATMNPQMAAWSHAPFAIEVERFSIEQLGSRFGYAEGSRDGVYCAGGAEANLTAVLCAIRNAIPEVIEKGVLGLKKRPIIYCSAHSHHSIARAARIAGLGSESVHSIPTLPGQIIDTNYLSNTIQKDRAQGMHPIMVVATAGNTGPGSIDPILEIGNICKEYQLWYHVDGAYGGAIILNEDYRHHLEGIEVADSITLDIHKWLSVPMATSVMLTRHMKILGQTFGMHAEYMPKDSDGMEVRDPYMNSIQWSRRFIGLKFYMSLVFYGWQGMSDLIEGPIRLGEYFGKQLLDGGWQIVNDTPLPVICFTDQNHIGELGYCQSLCNYILSTGKTWLSVYPIDDCEVLRVCINNYNTTEIEIDNLVGLLEEARIHVG